METRCYSGGGIARTSKLKSSYRDAFIAVPDDYVSMLAYAWVGGSIWGQMLGGVVAIIIAVTQFRSKWKEFSRQ